MKIRALLLILFISICNISFAQKSEKEKDFAIAFNDYCADITDSLNQFGYAWGEAFGTLYPTKSFKNLSAHSKKMIDFIARKQKELMNKKVNTDMEDLKLATIEFLSFEKSLLQEGFLPIEKLNESSTEAEIEALLNNLTQLANKEELALDNLRAQQNKLSKIYGFTIQDE